MKSSALIFFIIFIGLNFTSQIKQVPKSPTVKKQNKKPLKAVQEFVFKFKGFSCLLHDEASDGLGHHLLVGEIRPSTDKVSDRDSQINSLFGFKGRLNEDMGILILTNQKYQILKIAPAFVGKKIIYDSATKKFIIGANSLEYLKIGTQSFSAWQPVILQTDLSLQAKAYFI